MRFKIALWPIVISIIILLLAFIALYTLVSRTITSWEEEHLINTVDSIIVRVAEHPDLLDANPEHLFSSLSNDYTTYIEIYSASTKVIARSSNLKHTDLPCDPADTHFIQRLKLSNGTYLRIYQDALIINEQLIGYIVAGIPITQNIQYLEKFRIIFIVVLLCTMIIIGYIIHTLLSADIVQTQRTFLSFASHELRTGLCAIAGEAELLQRKKQTVQEYTQGLSAIEKSAQELMQTMTTWLTLFRNQVSPQKHTPLNLQTILSRALRDTQQRYPDRTYKITASDCVCLAHEEQLYEAFRNLLENAAKYSCPQTIIVASIKVLPKKCLITIKNTGGIPKPEQKRIFKPFYRSHRSTQNGFGIGLALVQMVIQQHHGKITVHSIRNTTNFTITLPRKSQ